MILEKTVKVCADIKLENNDDIMNLFRMTPYYYRTSESGIKKAEGLKFLETRIEFILGVYKK